MLSKLDIPLNGPSVNIVRKCGAALSDILDSKFGCVATIDGVDFEEDQSIGQQKRPTVVTEKRFEVTLTGGVTVSVWRADLTNFQVDAVVNAANEDLHHCGGLALALSTAGGPQIQKESDHFTAKNGKLQVGDAIVSGAGLLPCRKIIHAVGPQLSSNPHRSEVSYAEPHLRRAIWNILDRVKEYNLETVAIPAISSGLFHYPLPQCADTIVAAVKQYCESSPGLRLLKIMLVNNDEPTVKEMERACRQILSPHLPMTYSQVARKNRGGAKTSTLTVQMGNVHLTLKRGKIEEQETDVIVNSACNQDLSSGQISSALSRKAGPGMQHELNNGVMKGHVIITKPYKLNCKEVHHTFCTAKGQDTAEQILFKSVKECLWLAVTHYHESIAFPAIGTGGLGFSKEAAAQIMSHAVMDFAQASTRKLDVYFVIYPSDHDTFKAFEEQMKFLQQTPFHPSFTHATEHRDEVQRMSAPVPQISLTGPSDEATREADRWLHGLLFEFFGSVVICNNFILHFGEREHLQLSRLMAQGVTIEEAFERGRASIIVRGESHEKVVVAALQVEAILCNIQREFVKEEENTMFLMSTQNLSFERKTVDHYSPEFADRKSAFDEMGLRVVKVDKVENTTLSMIFNLKKRQLSCFTPDRGFQCIPAQFCEMVCRIGFHAECAPPDDPAYGEGIYFTSSVKKAMKVWKETNKEYLHFVEAEVLTGISTVGKPGLLLPPALGTDPQSVYNSLSGPEISVIFSGYQALPKYIITCRMRTP